MVRTIKPASGRACVIDGRKVRLPNATTLGYCKSTASPGDLIQHGERRELARVLGRIVSSDRDGERCDGFLYVLQLSDDATFSYVRWIDPAAVSVCHAPSAGLQAFAAFFFAERMPFDAAEIAELADHGTLSASYYTEAHAREVLETRRARCAPAK